MHLLCGYFLLIKMTAVTMAKAHLQSSANDYCARIEVEGIEGKGGGICIVTPQDQTNWLLYRGGLIIQWNLCIVATPQGPSSWLLYRGGLIIQWNLCIDTVPNQLAAIQKWQTVPFASNIFAF